MAKANSVHSTPPTNTSARHSRRSILGAIVATGAVAAAIPTAVLAAAPAVDPIYAVIAVHRNAHIAHMASLELQTRFERRYGIGKGGWISTKPCHEEDDAFMALVAEPTTTVQGLFAKLAYFDELVGEFETASFPSAENENRSALVDKWREAVAKKLLTPAPDLGAITWKRAKLKSSDFPYLPVKKERVERAIADDVAFLEAHPTRAKRGAS
jgi:hypothetical protein